MTRIIPLQPEHIISSTPRRSKTEGDICLQQLNDSMTADMPVMGTLEVPSTAFMIFVYDENGGARCVTRRYVHRTSAHSLYRSFNLLDTSDANISAFLQACETDPPLAERLQKCDNSLGRYRFLESAAFATSFVPEQTDIVGIVRQWLLEGADATREVQLILKEIRVYGASYSL